MLNELISAKAPIVRAGSSGVSYKMTFESGVVIESWTRPKVISYMVREVHIDTGHPDWEGWTISKIRELYPDIPSEIEPEIKREPDPKEVVYFTFQWTITYLDL